MTARAQAREIAKAIVRINRTAAVTGGNDARWIREDFAEFLRHYPFHRNLIERLLGLKRFPLFWPTRLSWLIYNRSRDPRMIACRIRWWFLSDIYAEATIHYLADRRFSDIGFPLNAYPNIGRLFRACLYRVSFGRLWRNAREFQTLVENKEFQGVYRIYLKRAGLDHVECRILLLGMVDDGYSVGAVEISKSPSARSAEEFRVRFGPVVPGFDVHTIVLSEISDRDTECTVKDMLRFSDEVTSSRYRIAEGLPLHQKSPPLPRSAVPTLQAQDLEFLAVRHTPELISGTFHYKDEVGRIEGQRMHRKDISLDDLNSITLPVPPKSIPNPTPLNIDLLERFNRRSFSSEASAMAEFEFLQMAYSSKNSQSNR